MTHTPLLLARWKAYQPSKELQDTLKAASKGIDSDKVNLYHVLPYSYLQSVDHAKLSEGVHVGCDNMLESQEDSYAGHFSGKMVADTKAGFVLLGDSERRKVFGESDASISCKLHKALEAQLRVFLCVEDPEQLQGCLEGITAEQLPHLVIVYQGSWASFYKDKGLVEELLTGQRHIRDTLIAIFGDAADAIPVVLALPSRLQDPSHLVENTIECCQGYYLFNAVLNPSAVTGMVKALASYQPAQVPQIPPTKEHLPEVVEESIPELLPEVVEESTQEQLPEVVEEPENLPEVVEPLDDIWVEAPGDQEASEPPQEEDKS